MNSQDMSAFLEGQSSISSDHQDLLNSTAYPDHPLVDVVLSKPVARPADYDWTLEDWWSDGEDVKSHPLRRTDKSL